MGSSISGEREGRTTGVGSGGVNRRMIAAGIVGSLLILVSLNFGTYPVAMAEMMTPRVRVSALWIGYNLSVGIFGVTTPMVAAYLIARRRDDLSPALYLVATAVVSIGVRLTIPETAGSDIDALLVREVG
jgi:MFS transporter, MHS family, proline/betaine transporter